MDKIHYYDGEIYRMLIDPNLSGLRQKILNNTPILLTMLSFITKLSLQFSHC